MACTHPMLMAVIDFKNTGYGFISRLRENNWKLNMGTQKAYRLVARDSREHELENIPSWVNCSDIEVPCGNCVQCRLDYSKTWAVRCYVESLQYQHNYFITLTYDEDNIKTGPSGNGTVCYEDVRKFIKSLRQTFKRKFNHDGIRFFGCTEYGDQSMRPHAHLILFNCPIPDLTYDFKNDDGTITHHKSSFGLMMYSQIIKDLWKYGFITIEDANYNTEAYVSRYIMKKQKGNNGKEVYGKLLQIEPPRLFMSLKPGIGGHYFMDNQDELLADPSIIVPRGDKPPMIAGIPRNYKKKLVEGNMAMYESLNLLAKENIQKSRSLLRGKSTMNNERQKQEDHTIRAFEAFGRNAI